MAGGADSGGPENGPGSKPATTVEVSGDRVRFRVDLTPGETTIVSWKKLLKEANVSEHGWPGPSSSGPSIELHGPHAAEAPAPPAPPAAASGVKKAVESEPKESQAQGGPNRLSNVIERIERMYAGSSDEEDLVLDNMPDDDEYDTEDSFIDDTELDDYFQVDYSATKHDGFFVNRGKLEHIEPTESMVQEPKKRRRKDSVQGGGSDDGCKPFKITKMGNKGKKASSSVPKGSASHIHKEAISNADVLGEDSPANPTEVSIKQTADIQGAVDPSGLKNADAISQSKDKKKPAVNPSEKQKSKLKESDLQNTSTQRSNDKISNVRKSHSGKQIDKGDGLEIDGLVERLDLNATASSPSLSAVKESPEQRKKDHRKNLAALEKAFEDLEKTVAEFRPPSTEPQVPANQSVKRRMPHEIRQNLEKVAILMYTCYGGIPKDIINRLMKILGHLMHRTTLRRNLRAMANMDLSAKQEKDDQIEKMKQEVAEMVKSRTSRMKAKLEQHDASSDDFQEARPEEREALKRKFSFDDALENKICDLYDLYVERLEKDSGPPVRKLYEELASMWPNGFMHTDRIRRAIYRAKDRKGLCSSSKDQEKAKKKKAEAPKAQDASNDTRATNSHQTPLPRDRGSKAVSNPVPKLANGPKQDNPKQEKAKKPVTSSSQNSNDVKLSSLLPKKKVKRKPDTEVAEAKLRLEKLAISPGGESAQTR